MNRLSSLITISLLFSPLSAHAQDAEQIRAELQAKLATLQGKEVELKNAESAILKREQSEQQRFKAFDEKLAGHATALSRWVSEGERFRAAVAEHEARCKGTFSNADYVAQCNNKLNDLEAWKTAANGRLDNLNAQKIVLTDEGTALNSDIKTTAERRARNKEQLKSVRANIVVMQEMKAKLNLNDSFLNDPRAREKIGNDCLPLTLPEALKECIDGVFEKLIKGG